MGASDPAAQKDQHGGIRRAKTCGCMPCKATLAAFQRDLAVENGLTPAPRSWGDRPAARVAALMPDGWRP